MKDGNCKFKVMKMIINATILLATALPLVMCGPGNTVQDTPDTPEVPVVPTDPVEGPVQKEITLSAFTDLNKGEAELNSHAGLTGRSSIKLIQSSYVEIPVKTLRVTYPNYPRITVLPDGTYFLTWQEADSSSDGNGRSVHCAKSSDLVNWEWQGYLWKQKTVTNGKGDVDTQNFTNANSIVLQDGRLMVIASFRTVHTYTTEDLKLEHGIMAKFSRDGGVTWEDEQQIFWGVNWEPDIIQQPDGEIQIYFADPRPWISSSNSGTAMIRSRDGGKTWDPVEGGEPYRVMRSEYYAQAKSRNLFSDQMPVGVILNGTKQMAFAVEVVKSWTSAKMTHQISVVYSPGDGNWKYLAANEGVADCRRLDGLDNNSDGIGPYLVQFRSGETVLVYTKGSNSKLFARLGNEKASDFLSEGLDPIFPKYGGWAGAKIESPHTMLVVNKFSQDGKRGIAVGRFALNHDITATSRTVYTNADKSEWSDGDDALYLGLGAENEATLRCSSDADNVYFLVEVSDSNISDTDKVSLTLSTPTSGDIIAKGSRRVTLTRKGLASVTAYASGKWEACESAAVACSVFDGTPDDSSDTDKGWYAEVTIPKSELLISGGKMSLNAEFYDSNINKTDKLTSKVYVSGL